MVAWRFILMHVRSASAVLVVQMDVNPKCFAGSQRRSFANQRLTRMASKIVTGSKLKVQNDFQDEAFVARCNESVKKRCASIKRFGKGFQGLLRRASEQNGK